MATTFNDGGIHECTAPIGMTVFVQDGPGPTPTNFIMRDGCVVDNFEVSGSSVVQVEGGRGLDDSRAFDNASIVVTGGDAEDLHGHDASSILLLTGGAADTLDACGESAAPCTATILVSGGMVEFLNASLNGIITLVGEDFMVDLLPVPLGPLSATSGTLAGFLSDGTTLNVPFLRDPTATILLVPEPSTAGLLILGLALLGTRRRA